VRPRRPTGQQLPSPFPNRAGQWSPPRPAVRPRRPVATAAGILRRRSRQHPLPPCALPLGAARRLSKHGFWRRFDLSRAPARVHPRCRRHALSPRSITPNALQTRSKRTRASPDRVASKAAPPQPLASAPVAARRCAPRRPCTTPLLTGHFSLLVRANIKASHYHLSDPLAVCFAAGKCRRRLSSVYPPRFTVASTPHRLPSSTRRSRSTAMSRGFCRSRRTPIPFAGAPPPVPPPR
jgi:hypothetical protein